MNASLRDLKRQIDETPSPSLDVEDIVARGDARLRRRRAVLAAGSASLAVAVIVAVVALPRSNQRSSSPVDTPSPSVTENAAPTGARPLTYSDDYTVDPSADIGWWMQSIRYGDGTLRPGIDATAIDLTDDGLVMVAPDGGVHFTDGETTEKIGETESLVGGSFREWSVKTSPSGSLVAWFTPGHSLVVHDTHEHRMLAEIPRPGCVPDGCILVAAVGDRVYYADDPEYWREGQGPLMVLDVTTETVSETDARALAEDLRSQPRGFVKGDNYDTGEVVNQDVNDEAVFFTPRDATLELTRIVRGEGTNTPVFGYGGFDTTGRRLNLHLPAGYSPAEHPYALFQWLDDDRFAVMAGAVDFVEPGEGYGDILVCDIAEERCTLAAPGPGPGPDGNLRLVPHLTLPN